MAGWFSYIYMTVLILPALALLMMGVGQPIVSRQHHIGAAGDSTCHAATSLGDAQVVIALTDGGANLVALDVARDSVLHSWYIGPVRHFDRSFGHIGGSLALDGKRCEVIAAAVDSARGTTRVVAVSLRDWQIHTVTTITDTTGFPWVNVGESSGKLYLMAGVGIEVAVIDRLTGAITSRISASRPGGARWMVYRARVTPDERRMYVSYHGQGANASTGMDWVELGTQSRCTLSPGPAASPGRTCAHDVHGDFNFLGNDIIAASGGPDILLVDSAGTTRLTWQLGLINSYGLPPHFMELALDPRRREAYGANICSMGNGLSAVAIGERVGSAPQAAITQAVCGELIVPAADGVTLIVARYSPGVVSLVDLESGRLVGTSKAGKLGDRLVDVVGVATAHL